MAKKNESLTKKHDNEKIKDSCFVIMPFGSYYDTYYDEIYKPAIEKCDLIPTKADDIYRPGTIVQDIWNYTKQAKIVLADLTGKNPNVFYELGLAHSLAKPAILISNTMDDVPFDLRALRVITYDKNQPNWGVSLNSTIQKSIKETIKSPISSVLPAFINSRDMEKTTISISERDFLELKKDLELLKHELMRVRNTSQPRMRSDEAENRIKKMLENQIPPNEIVRRLVIYGVPESWAIKKIKELKSDLFSDTITSPPLE